MRARPLWITEADVAAAVSLPQAVDAVRSALLSQREGRATTLEKTAAPFATSSTLHALGGVDEAKGVVGTKTWAHTAGGATPLVTLWDAADGLLLAVIEAFAMGQLRTAAISAVATDALATPEADVLAIVGTGKQALPQVAAVACVRPIRQIRVHSPTAERRGAFCAAVRAELPDVEVIDAASIAEAAAGAPIVTTVTRATDAFLDRWDLVTDVLVNAVGAITPERRELAPGLVAVASRVVSDSPMAATTLSAELDFADAVVPLCDVVGAPGSASPGVTIFKAMGLGLADVALGATVLDRVVAAGGGQPIPPPERAAPRLFDRARRPAVAT